jgi:predicted flap endonuclease-1-like 5' DNA nuclease
MRKLILFLILGGLLIFLILEYFVHNEERKLKRSAPAVPSPDEELQHAAAATTATRRGWQGTDSGLFAKDDLTLINGIGPAFERALNAVGIHSFAQLARQTPEELASQLAARVTAERIRRDRWIEQARELARSS